MNQYGDEIAILGTLSSVGLKTFKVYSNVDIRGESTVSLISLGEDLCSVNFMDEFLV